MTEKGWGVDIRSSPVEADPRFSGLGRTGWIGAPFRKGKWSHDDLESNIPQVSQMCSNSIHRFCLEVALIMYG